jgi:hypothetical protein
LGSSEDPFLGYKLAATVCSLQLQLAQLEPVEEEGDRHSLPVVEVRHTGPAEAVLEDHPDIMLVYIQLSTNVTSSASLLVRIENSRVETKNRESLD